MRALFRLASWCTGHRPPSAALHAAAACLAVQGTPPGSPVRYYQGRPGLAVPPSALMHATADSPAPSKQARELFVSDQPRGRIRANVIQSVGCPSAPSPWRHVGDQARRTSTLHVRYANDRKQAPQAPEFEARAQGREKVLTVRTTHACAVLRDTASRERHLAAVGHAWLSEAPRCQ